MYAREMLEAHPRSPQIDQNVLLTCIEACYACAQSCTACADACLGEQRAGELVRCIRLNLDCADICEITGAMLSRQTEPDWRLLRRQVEACAAVCRACGDECDRHAGHHQHCLICAQACRRCDDACSRLSEIAPV